MNARADYRMNWQMPAEPLGERVQSPIAVPSDPIRAFETMRDPAPELPDDVREASDGEYKVKCCCCGKWVPMLCSLKEHMEGAYYCSGSERCIP